MYPNNSTYPGDMYQSQIYTPQDPGKSFKKKIILAGSALLLVLLFFWVAGRSAVEIQTGNTEGNGKISYVITDESGKATSKTTDAVNFKKYLPSGTYEIRVRQGDLSYLSYVHTKGFFRTTKVTAGLASESARRFVGGNPGDCMNYIGSTLLSSDCGLGYENLQVHKPATEDLPTTTEGLISQQLYGPLEGIAHTKFGTVALVQQSYSEDEPRGHYASLISDTLVDSNRTYLKDLSADKTYALQPYREGFVAYATDFTSVYYVAGLSVAPVRIPVQAPKGKAFRPYLTTASNDAVVVAYSDNLDDEIVEYAKKTDNRDANLDIAVLDGTNERHFSFKKNASQVLYCGNDRLCLLTDDMVRVYDISGKKPRELFVVRKAKNMQMTPKGLVVATASGVLLINTQDSTGFVEYSLGNYLYCGMAPAKEGYVLCIQTKRGQKNGLLIRQDDRTNDNVDKKVLTLADTTGVSFVSPYGDYIYVVPDYGVPEYNAELGGDSYDPATVQRVNAAIAKAAETTGLNKPPYKVVSTGF